MNTIQSHTTFSGITFKPDKILHNYVFSPLAGVLLKDWLRLVKNSDYYISPQYWPRSVFTAIMAATNSLLSKFEEHRYGEMIEREKVKKPIFIVGHHRSGTTHLWNLITTNPNFVYPKLTQTLFPSTFCRFSR